MNVLPTRVHAISDYVLGIVLIVAPYFLGFADGGPAQWIPTIIGVAILASSLMTNYEYSFARLIPMPLHLALDLVAGVLLLASPWLFHFSDVYVPHVILGILEVAIAAVTQWRPSFAPSSEHPTGLTA